MTKQIIAQVKYCRTNEELNSYLRKLYTDGDENHYPKLKNILYIENTREKQVESDKVVLWEEEVKSLSPVIAIVEVLDILYVKDGDMLGVN